MKQMISWVILAYRGLLIPNVKDTDPLDLIGLTKAIDAAITAARAGKATPRDLTGGTLTITTSARSGST